MSLSTSPNHEPSPLRQPLTRHATALSRKKSSRSVVRDAETVGKPRWKNLTVRNYGGKVSYWDWGSGSSVGIGYGCGVLGRKLLCRDWCPAKRGGRVMQGLVVQVQVMRCYIHADARGGVLVICGMVQRRCRLHLVSAGRVVCTSCTAIAANLPLHIFVGGYLRRFCIFMVPLHAR
jgi:hypothetical protein